MQPSLEKLRRQPLRSNTIARSAARRGMTLVEITVALTVCGFLMLGVTRALVDTGTIALKTSGSLEHAHNSRELIDRLAQDIGEAQILVLYPSFSDRSTTLRDGNSGNYLAIHWINSTGTIIRTIGYYAMPDASGTGWVLYRHDSRDGLVAAGSLPGSTTSGTHRVVTRAVRLPDSNKIFRCIRDRGIILRGEFGTPGLTRGRTEFVQCAISTRS